MNSSAAISLFERPRAASSATRRSVSVNSSEAGARPLIRLSSARALSAQSRAPRSSKIASACSSAWRDAFFCCACLRTDTETEQRPAALEREGLSVQLGEGALEGGARAGHVSLGGGEQATATGGDGDGPRVSDASAVLLVSAEVVPGLVELAERDEGLDRISPEWRRRVVVPERERPAGDVAEVDASGFEVAERELESPEHATAREYVDLIRHLLRKLETFLPARRASSTRPRSVSISAVTRPMKMR